MSRVKAKKTFLKVKEKLVFVETQPKKFFTKKFFGIALLTSGVFLLLVTLVGLFVLPKLTKSEFSLVWPKGESFVAERVIFPDLGLDFLVKDSQIEEKFKIKESDFKIGGEFLVLGEGNYESFLVLNVEGKDSSESGSLSQVDGGINLVLPLNGNSKRVIIVNALKQN